MHPIQGSLHGLQELSEVRKAPLKHFVHLSGLFSSQETHPGAHLEHRPSESWKPSTQVSQECLLEQAKHPVEQVTTVLLTTKTPIGLEVSGLF